MTGEFHIIYCTYNHGQFLFLRLYSFRLISKSPLFFFLGGYARSVVAHPSAWKLPSLTFKNLRMFNTRLTLFRRYSDVIQSESSLGAFFDFQATLKRRLEIQREANNEEEDDDKKPRR